MNAEAARTSPPVPLSDILAGSNGRVIGTLDPRTSFRWIERNSREIDPGDLFIAVKGEIHDGHAFIQDAAKRGATAALVSRAWAEHHPEPPLPVIVVDEPVRALQQLATARRRNLDLAVVGITGSIGKTSTKETVAAVLQHHFRTYRSPGNMNSEIGLPLSILEIPAGTDVAVLEMGGAYAPGEVALLATIAQPTVGLVTNVHPVHLERMGTIEAIAQTKAELVESLPADGYAILNGDDFRVRAMAKKTTARLITYGLGPSNDFWAENVRTLGEAGIAFTLHSPAGTHRLQLPLVGVHAVELAIAALATGFAFGLSLEAMIPGLMDRSVQVRLVPLNGPKNSRLIDDTYNASAPSVLSALRLLAESSAVRRIAVLGDMRELGAESAAQHAIVGARAAEVADVILTYGDLARMIASAATARAGVDGRKVDVQSYGADQREELIETLRSDLRAGDLVLLKGSRGLEMERIVRSLHTTAEAANSDECPI